MDNFFVIEQKEIMGYFVDCICDIGLTTEILRIALHPDHRGKSVARELLEASPWVLSKKNIENVELSFNSENRSAEKLREKFGFKITRIFTFLEDQDFYIVMKGN